MKDFDPPTSTCQLCERQVPRGMITLHHLKPKERGGKWTRHVIRADKAYDPHAYSTSFACFAEAFNGDGYADRAVDLIDGLKDGPMGLLAEGDSLFVVADGGLKRYRGYNGRDKLKGPPEVLLALKTTGEHEAHAVRRGPDGWLYLLCGNMAGVRKEIITGDRSPVAAGRAERTASTATSCAKSPMRRRKRWCSLRAGSPGMTAATRHG